MDYLLPRRSVRKYEYAADCTDSEKVRCTFKYPSLEASVVWLGAMVKDAALISSSWVEPIERPSLYCRLKLNQSNHSPSHAPLPPPAARATRLLFTNKIFAGGLDYRPHSMPSVLAILQTA